MASARIGFLLAASALAAGALVPSPAAPRPASPEVEQQPLLGVVQQRSSLLVHVDPRTLQPLPSRRIAVGPHLHGWALSPDRSRLAFSRHPGGVLQVVDANTFRPRGKMVFSGDGLLAWLAPRRPLWIQRPKFALVDPVTRRRLIAKRINGPVFGGVRAGDQVALLGAPARGIGASHLLVVDAAGRTRSVVLARIRSGGGVPCGGESPGVALDPERKRVFVVGTDGMVAEVELATLAISYHSLGDTVSPLASGVCEHRSRTARSLGGDLIAVSGTDRRDFRGAGGQRYSRSDPAGLDLVDVRSWSARTLDQDADSFRFAERLLLATGMRWDTSVSSTITWMGVAAYALDGTQRFHLFQGQQAWVDEVHAGRAYVSFERGPVAVVDLDRGAVVGERSTPVPRLLVDDGVSLFGR